MRKIGIVGGAGWMGAAMVHALLETDFLKQDNLWVAHHHAHNPFIEKYPHLHFTTNIQELIDACHVVILSVRPHQFNNLVFQMHEGLLISIMASVSVEAIQHRTTAKNIIRAMPNAALSVRQSYTPWYATDTVTMADKDLAGEIFNCLGVEDEFAHEEQINLLTALTGSSHGWLAYLADALVSFGTAHGLDVQLTQRAVRQVMKGVGELIATEVATPAETVKIVTEYGGTTAAGIKSFMKDEISEKIHRGLMASYQKAKA